MKNTITQMQLLVSRIDRRYLQVAYFALALAATILRAPTAPTDGGGGPF
jgi:hypothetical protein